MPYSEQNFAAEVRARGLHGLSPEGRAYFQRTAREDFERGIAQANDRFAARASAEAAAAIENAFVVAAVRSVEPDTPEPTTYSEREHMRRLAQSWDDAGY